ncbi:MAG: (5-formylfuran-3-yl)methyl phosphate synthase [Lacipirellulaceae bacterium]
MSRTAFSMCDAKANEAGQQAGLLVSVRDVAEAQIAMRGGVDWIDLKEPGNGALGAVSGSVAQQVVDLVERRLPVSAAAGELLEWPTSQARELLAVEHLQILKLALAGCKNVPGWRQLWQEAASEIQESGKQLAAVAYADFGRAQAPAIEVVLAEAIELGLQTLLIDTFDKSAGPLTTHVPTATLASYLRKARAAGLRTVVAGKLTPEIIRELPLESVDLVAVRSAVTTGDREGPISPDRIKELSTILEAAQ